MMKILKWIVPLLASAVLVACQLAPEGLGRDNAIISYKALQTADFACNCEQVRLGGKVIRATALAQQTEIEVLSMAVDRFTAKPILASQSDGRFIAVLNGFVDPLSLQDQYITVRGVLSGRQEGKIDQAQYVYPKIKVEDYHIWQQVIEYYYDEDEWADYWEGRRYGRFFGPIPTRYPRPALR
ncbi:Slp family lipoprotein [Testudinibacter sp. TR-2022]|uniref:Slp family lipoprotein n=1 Tax=Testudinibacter sp. TR-2022 TaxID=2585029 RepID=UPI001117E4C4|nr:Slp family lipoprotein [Testudinibacter sp. TR-2022]TNH05637.1 Slp family lipoprotein [Pasteurellaceae bacterium Phil31]TNH06051.1 Slp family lipoprotein [Testudinibacter sp. TR-2022]TNH09997.1 Slp family lipoprotein [Testudinibacter sp. TR-2022]TNH13570.1 Slp family lipoprotein [Testudinibacter sp. TR-2022]TNH19304.1 Slp family lipoprotein [Testudinibacter sp. TR-2022]